MREEGRKGRREGREGDGRKMKEGRGEGRREGREGRGYTQGGDSKAL